MLCLPFRSSFITFPPFSLVCRIIRVLRTRAKKTAAEICRSKEGMEKKKKSHPYCVCGFFCRYTRNGTYFLRKARARQPYASQIERAVKKPSFRSSSQCGPCFRVGVGELKLHTHARCDVSVLDLFVSRICSMTMCESAMEP